MLDFPLQAPLRLPLPCISLRISWESLSKSTFSSKPVRKITSLSSHRIWFMTSAILLWVTSMLGSSGSNAELPLITSKRLSKASCIAHENVWQWKGGGLEQPFRQDL